jgi:hypothetical protein
MEPYNDRYPLCGTPLDHATFVRITDGIRERERKRLGEHRQQAALEIEKKIAKAIAKSEERHQRELVKQRDVLSKETDVQHLKLQQHTREREALQKRIFELSRRVQRESANQLGDEAEHDLYDTLRNAFPDDKITRIRKGTEGADILHVVLHKSQLCGRILVESKNVRGWQNAYLTKLRQDQVETEADHAVLSTTTFPSGARELCIREGLIIVSPARAVHIIEILRRFTIQLHIQGVSAEERPNKAAKLYAFISSQGWTRLFGELGEIADKLEALDVSEVRDHRKVWGIRGRLTTRLKNAINEIDAEIASIVEPKKKEDS